MSHRTRLALRVSTFTTAVLAPIGVLLAIGGLALLLTAMTEIRTTLPTLLSADAYGMSGESNARPVAVTHPPPWLNARGRCRGEVLTVSVRQPSVMVDGVACLSPAASRQSQKPDRRIDPFRPDLREDLMQMTIAQRWYRQLRSPDRPNTGPR